MSAAYGKKSTTTVSSDAFAQADGSHSALRAVMTTYKGRDAISDRAAKIARSRIS